MSRTGIFHVLFTFYFIALTLIITVQSLIPNTNSHSLLSISSSYFVSDHQENQKRVYSIPERSQHNAKTTADGPLQGRTKQQGYLIVQQDDRSRNPLQDRRVGTVTHQQAHQGVTFQGVHWNAQLQPVE